jgi:hypothetical protein
VVLDVALDGFRVSSPILTDTLQADSTGQAVTAPVLVARRTFLGNATLFCQYTVFGAARADGRLLRLYGIALAGLSPGDYELTLAVRDELAVKAVELREPFTVERALGVWPATSQ